MIIENEIQLDFKDVLFKPKRTTLNSRSDADVSRKYKFKWCPRILSGTGIMAANMATTGTFEMAKKLQEHNMFTCLHKHYSFEELLDFFTTQIHNDYVFVSTGIKDGDFEKVSKILDTGLCQNVCIDIANGYIPNLIEFVKKIRKNYPHYLIMVGNVVTGDMVQDLILNGADIVKVGIGGGSVCTTRKLTGVGRPQMSAIIDCADAAHGVGGMICGDGGCTCVGDIAKAFGAGADFVMLGGMLAGTDESSGELIEKVFKTNECIYDMSENHEYLGILEEKKKYKQFYGMSSQLAQEKHWGGMAKYRASEGKVVEVEYKGSVVNLIQEILGGLRSTMSYIGAQRLKDIPKCTTFYRVSTQLNEVFGRS